MTRVIARAFAAWPQFESSGDGAQDRYLALVGVAAVLVQVLVPPSWQSSVGLDPPGTAEETQDERAAAIAARESVASRVRFEGNEVLIAAYGGAHMTYASDLRIERKDTRMTVHGIEWQGKPFEHPIYYGARAVRWLPSSRIGAMVDFTHSKAYAPMEQTAKLSGTMNDKPLPPEGMLGNLFHKLEFTHGHNMLTLNVLWRLPFSNAFVSPYLGLGFGASLPHTEVQLKDGGLRTYEYQYTGPAAQALIGVEFRVPRLSYFVEYKFTTASYHAPLHNRDGGLLPEDLWHQLRRWMRGSEPEGGWAWTWLAGHQVIAGIGVRTGVQPLPAP